MVTFEWHGGFHYVLLDGVRVACADTTTSNEARARGFVPASYSPVPDLDVVCAMLGTEYHAAYVAKYPSVKPAPKTAAEKRRDRARYYRELRGW